MKSKNKPHNTILVLVLLYSNLIFSQSPAPINTVCTLPGVINESSGIEKTGPNVFWSHNDSGGQPDIYKFDSTGTLIKTITITNATNIDWEDITEDDNGDFYIGDFGNNNNNRSVANNNQLRIYKITDPDLIPSTTTTASIINFEYVDRNFAAPAGNHNFDMEAFFFFNDSLHLFTKNRTSPTTGWIKHYILPKTAGTYTAMLVDSFNNAGIRITSADISPNKKTVALMAQTNIWLFSCYQGSKFLSTGSNTLLTLPNTQKEAIVFSNDTMVYITDEFTSPIGQKLYRSNLKSFIAKPLGLNGNITPACPATANGAIVVTPTGGIAPFTYTWSNNVFSSANPSLTSGNYSVTIKDSKGCKFGVTYPVTNYTPTPVVIQLNNYTLQSNYPLGNQWYFNGVSIPGATSNSLTPTNVGGYYVSVTDGNGCSVISNTIMVNEVGFDEKIILMGIKVYYDGSDYIIENTNTFSIDLELFDITGRPLQKAKITPKEMFHYNSQRLLMLIRITNAERQLIYNLLKY